jgi:hypothetical protein
LMPLSPTYTSSLDSNLATLSSTFTKTINVVSTISPTFTKTINTISALSPTFTSTETVSGLSSYKIFRRADNRSHQAEIAETEAAILAITKRETSGTISLYGLDDIFTTTVYFGTGSAVTDITIGNSTSTTSFQGDLTVTGSFGTVDDLLLINNFSTSGNPSGFAVERGSTGDDALIYWEEFGDRFELGFFDTVSGTTAPAGTLTNFSDLKINNLLLDSTDITADGALTVTATGANDLAFTARGSTINLNESGNTSLVGFTATTILGAFNELKTSGSSSITYISNDYTNGEAGSITEGQLVYISTTDTVKLASAASNNSLAKMVGVVGVTSIATSSSDTIRSEGVTNVKFELSLALSAGDEIFLSASTAGSATNIKPSGSGNVIKSIGSIKDLGTYDGNTNLLAEAHLIPGPPEIIS